MYFWSIENKMGNRITETNEDLLIKLKASNEATRKASNNSNNIFFAEHNNNNINYLDATCHSNDNSEKEDMLLLEVGLNHADNIDSSSAPFAGQEADSTRKQSSLKQMGKIRVAAKKKGGGKEAPASAEVQASLEAKEPIRKTNSLLLPPLNTSGGGGRSAGGRRESFLHRADIEFFDSSQKVRKSSMNSTERSESWVALVFLGKGGGVWQLASFFYCES